MIPLCYNKIYRRICEILATVDKQDSIVTYTSSTFIYEDKHKLESNYIGDAVIGYGLERLAILHT